jgi:hypothetical protein
MVRAAMTPLADSQQHATSNWIENHFDTYGDHSPNSLETHLSISSKKEVWLVYKKEFEEKGMDVVTKEKFNELWNVLFPHFLIRPWINVPGKCDTCFEIDAQRRTCKDLLVLEALKQCHHLHRGGLFMPERKWYYDDLYFLPLLLSLAINLSSTYCLICSYKRNIARALAHREIVFSCIIDGMDQNHSKVPHLGSQQSFGYPLKQHIQGVLEHGIGKYQYNNKLLIIKLCYYYFYQLYILSTRCHLV